MRYLKCPGHFCVVGPMQQLLLAVLCSKKASTCNERDEWDIQIASATLALLAPCSSCSSQCCAARKQARAMNETSEIFKLPPPLLRCWPHAAAAPRSAVQQESKHVQRTRQVRYLNCLRHFCVVGPMQQLLLAVLCSKKASTCKERVRYLNCLGHFCVVGPMQQLLLAVL